MDKETLETGLRIRTEVLGKEYGLAFRELIDAHYTEIEG